MNSQLWRTSRLDEVFGDLESGAIRPVDIACIFDTAPGAVERATGEQGACRPGPKIELGAGRVVEDDRLQHRCGPRQGDPVMIPQPRPQRAVVGAVEDARGQRGGQVGRLERERDIVDGSQAMEDVHVRVVVELQRKAHRWAGILAVGPQQPGRRAQTQPVHFLREAADVEAHAGFGDEGAAWGSAVDHALALQQRQRLPGRHPADLVLLGEFALRGQQGVGSELVSGYPVTHCLGDRDIARRRGLALSAHRGRHPSSLTTWSSPGGCEQFVAGLDSAVHHTDTLAQPHGLYHLEEPPMWEPQPSSTSGGDAAELAQFGYPQSMERQTGKFASFAVAFAFVSIATGIFTTYGAVLNSSGPVGIWTWPIAVLGQLAVAFVLGTIASRIPVTGYAYQWMSRLANPILGWIIGWISFTFLAVVVVAVDYTIASTVLPVLLNYDGTSAVTWAVTALVLVAQAALLALSTKWSQRFNNGAVSLELMGMGS